MRKAVFWSMLVLIFTLPWEGIIQIGTAVRVSRAVGLVVGALWVGVVAITGRLRKPQPLQIAVLMFAIWNVASVLWTDNYALTLSQSLTYVQLALLVYILWDTIRSYDDLRAAMQAYVLGAWLAVISLFVDYAHGGAQYHVRYTIGTFEVNALGLVLGLAVPLAWYLVVAPDSSTRHRFIAVLNLAYIPAAVIAIMLTGSRSAIVSLLPGIAYIAWGLIRLGLSGRVLAVVVLATVGFFLASKPLVPERTAQRLATTSSAINLRDIGGRLVTWREAYETFADHPILGVGSGAFQAEATQKAAHNVALRFLAELGLIGFSLFALILVFTVSGLRGQPRSLTSLWISLLLIWAIGASVHNFEDRKQTWLLVGFVAVGAGLTTEPSRGERRSSLRLAGSSSIDVR